jgi:regulator of RNase E activity RraA
VINGTVIEPGDLILGDLNGVVSVPRVDAHNILKATIKKHEAETRQMAETEAGTVNHDWVDNELQEVGREFID